MLSRGFVSDAQIALDRTATSKIISKERERVIKFISNVKARFDRFKKVFKQGRITRPQLEKVQNWAKGHDLQARTGFEAFRQKNAVKLLSKINANQQVQAKL